MCGDVLTRVLYSGFLDDASDTLFDSSLAVNRGRTATDMQTRKKVKSLLQLEIFQSSEQFQCGASLIFYESRT